MATFKDRIFGQHVPKEIIDRFDALQLGKSNAPLESVSKPYSHNLGESTAFARMWTAVDVVTQGQLGPDGEVIKQNTDGDYYYIVKSTGDAAIIPDYDPAEEVHNIQIYSINENREKSYTDNPLDFQLGDGKTRYVNQLRHNKLLKGSAGITSITSRTEGALGATIRTVVEFVVHNKRDFDEIILPFFLRPGSNVCIDFGREYTSGGGFNLYDPLEYIANESVDMEKFYEQIYKPDEGEMAKNFGSLQVRLGVVDNYDMNINTEGSFVCSLEFMSENTTLIDRNITPYNNLEYAFNTVLDVVLLNVLSTYQTGRQFINIDDVFNKRELFSGIADDAAVERELQNFFDKASVSAADGTRDTMGVLSKEAILTGIFHQNLSQWDNVWLQSATREEKEKTYITLGRLEDLYLNNFVATVIDPNRYKGGQINPDTPGFTKVPEENYEIQYDSRKGLVRWDQKLFDLQNCILLPNEELNDFIIPDNWDNSYNTLKGKLTNDVSEDVEESNDESEEPPAEPEDSTFNETTGLPENEPRDKSNPRFPGIDVMPIREIFISTELIKESFRTESTVEKALNSIFKRLNNQSGGIWNIKIISSNDANTQLCFHDANLLSEQTKRLTFDVTSNNSIVSTCNLKFVKSTELSNLISIRSLAEGSYLEDQEGLQSLAHLNSLNSEDNLTFKRIKSLPFRGSANIDNKRTGIDIDPEALKKSIEVAPRSDDITIYSPEGWNDLIASIDSRKQKRKKSIDENKGIFGRISYKDPVLSQDGPVNAVGQGNQRGANFGSGGSGQNLVFQNFDGFSKQRIKEEIEKSTEIVASEREVIIKELRKKYMGESTPGSIAPILPLELELTVYGNSYLQPGDLIDINYLPKSYKDKVMFQILEVEQKVEPSNWLTSYLAVMRFEPKYKFIAAGSEKPQKTYTTSVKTEEKIIEVKVEEEIVEEEPNDIVEKDEKGEVISEPEPETETETNETESENKETAAPSQPVGTINDLGLVNNSLVFKVFSQQKFPLINDKFMEAGKIQTFNHATTVVQDVEKFRDVKNIAYLSAIKSVVFDLIFDKSEINVVFANDIFNEDYNKDNYVKNNVPLQCVIEPFTDEEMKKIFDLHPGEQVDLGKYLNMIPRKYEGDGSTEYADFMKDANVELPKFDGSKETVMVSRFFKRMTFIASDGDENGNPDKMYYFRNQNGLDLLMKKENPPNVSLAIPQSVLRSVEMSYQQFAGRIEQQYNLYLEALKDLGRPRPTVEQQTEPKVFVTYARPAETEAPSGAIIEEPGSLLGITDDSGKSIGPLFLVYRIGNSEGTFDNMTDRNTFYAKTLATIEVEGKPPSDPILVEGQTRKTLANRRSVSLSLLKQNSVTRARTQARKEADKRKNS